MFHCLNPTSNNYKWTLILSKLQLIVLLDFIYQVNEWLLERDNCAPVLVGVTGVLIAGTLVGMGFLYKVNLTS